MLTLLGMLLFYQGQSGEEWSGSLVLNSFDAETVKQQQKNCRQNYDTQTYAIREEG